MAQIFLARLGISQGAGRPFESDRRPIRSNVGALICPSCRSENRAEARLCDACGSALVLRCRSCDNELRPEARFCDGCSVATDAARAGSGSGRRTVSRWIVLAVVAWVGTAGLVLLGREAAADPTEPTAFEPAELERLRALGYADFAEDVVEPDAAVVPVYDQRRSAPGLNLYVTWRMSRADLIDPVGRVLRSWSHRPSEVWSNAELTADGDLLVNGFDQQPYILKMSWGGEVIWRHSLPSHHDVERSPDGRIVTLVERRRRVPQIHGETDILDHGIAVLSADGVLLTEHSLYDMLSAAPDVFHFQHQSVDTKRKIIDPFHSNSVDILRSPQLEERSQIYAVGNVIVSIRHQDSIAIFDLRTARVVWAWGQGELSGPHDASMLDNGNILVFDNGVQRRWSRVIELDPLKKQIVWEYRAPQRKDFFTLARGSSQRLDNGNTLIATRTTARPSR